MTHERLHRVRAGRHGAAMNLRRQRPEPTLMGPERPIRVVGPAQQALNEREALGLARADEAIRLLTLAGVRAHRHVQSAVVHVPLDADDAEWLALELARRRGGRALKRVEQALWAREAGGDADAS